MKVLREGHGYLLANSVDVSKFQEIHFVEKEPNGTELILVNDGCQNIDIYEVIINRLEYLQGKFPCAENEGQINFVKSAMELDIARTKARIAKNVEGKQITH